MDGCANSGLTTSVWPQNAASINAVASCQFLAFTSMDGCANSGLTTPVWPLNAAIINAVAFSEYVASLTSMPDSTNKGMSWA